VIGVVLLIFAMAVIGPVGLFLVGAIWSAGFGWFLSEDADRQPEAQPSAS
jgi:uncharacterized SAM-binding protein YcdF (DUF218 family)